MSTQPDARRSANTEDPRYRRSREQICRTVRQLLTSTDPARLTFAQVANAAGVNRSTLHQHYATRHELVADALAGALEKVAGPLARCPFDETGAQPPAELVAVFTAADDQRQILNRLGDTDRCLVIERLADRLSEQLQSRFADGRPPGFDPVPSGVHAQYVAGGLARLLVTGATEPPESAVQAWRLISPIS